LSWSFAANYSRIRASNGDNLMLTSRNLTLLLTFSDIKSTILVKASP